MVFHIGCNAQAVQRDKNAFVKYLNSVGLDTHEEADVCTECVGLGVVVDGKRREARPRAERVSRLRKAISVITAGTPTSRHQLEIVIRHIFCIFFNSEV